MAQFVVILLGFAKSKLIFSQIGAEKFSQIAVYLSVWLLFGLVGESERSLIRQLSPNDGEAFADIIVGRMKSSAKVIIIIFIILLVVIHLLIGSSLTRQFLYLFVIAFGGFIYSVVSLFVGRTESQGSIVRVNVIIIIGNIVTFPIFIFFLHFMGSIGVLVSFVLSSCSTGLYLVFKFHVVHRIGKLAFAKVASGRVSPFLLILLFESLGYAVDSLLVSSNFDANHVTVFSLVQKVSIIFGLLPISLSVVRSLNNANRANKSSIKLMFWVGLSFTFVSSLIFLVVVPIVISIITANSIRAPLNLLYAFVFAGVTGILTAQTVDSANALKDTKVRTRIIVPLSLLNLILSYFGFHYLGFAAPIWVNGIIQLVYAFSIKLLIP